MGSCPHCGLDLTDPDGWDRRIGVEVQSVYDGVLFWLCPGCGGTWHRFPVGDPLRVRADAYVARTGQEVKG